MTIKARMAAAARRLDDLRAVRGDRDLAECVNLVLAGFDDVRAWLEGDAGAAMPDPHRLADLLRWPYDKGVAIDDVGYFEALWAVTWLCCKQRKSNQTGEPIPDDVDAADVWLLTDHDKVTGSLLHNASTWLQYAEGKRAGTIPRNKAIIGDLVVIPFVPGECGPGCRWYGRGDGDH